MAPAAMEVPAVDAMEKSVASGSPTMVQAAMEVVGKLETSAAAGSPVMEPAAMEVVDVLKSLNTASMAELQGHELPDDC